MDGSKKKSMLRQSTVNSLYQNYLEESNSKKRISWGGIHTRWFNEQANQNWDVSPQSLRSGSDKSRSVDVSNMTDEKLYEQQQIVLQNMNTTKENQNDIQMKADQDQYRLSMYFKSNEGNYNDESLLLPSNRVSTNYQENVYKRVSNQNVQINGQRDYLQNGYGLNDNSLMLNDSESNLLDNIDRQSRLSGLFESDLRQHDNSDILLPIQEIQNKYQSDLQQQSGQQQNQSANLQNNATNHNKDTIVFFNDKNQFENLNYNSNNNYNIFQGNQNNQNLQIQQGQQSKAANNNQQGIAQNNFPPSQNIIQNQAENALKYQNKDINQNLFKNYHVFEKNEKVNEINSQQNQNLNVQDNKENQSKQFNRLSEFFQQDGAKTEQKPNLRNENQVHITNQKQQDQMIFDQNFSSINPNLYDSNKRTFPFSIGFASDVFNESKSSGNDNSSYLLECLDKVNRLSDVNPPKYDMVDEKILSKKIPLITPSPLVNDLKSLSLDLEDDEDDVSNNKNFHKHINSSIKVAKEKRVRMKDELDEVKQGDLFSNEMMLNESSIQHQQKPKSILANQKMISENQSIISKQKVQIKTQLNKLISDNATNPASGSKFSPKKISISKSILPNSSISKEIKRISLIPKENNIKYPHSSNYSKEKQQLLSKGTANQQLISSDNKENLNLANNTIVQTHPGDYIKNTPIRRSNFFQEDDIHSENSDDVSEGIEELENIVVRMPLNSYEKKVILNFLTPGKKSKNLQLIRETILTNNNSSMPQEVQKQFQEGNAQQQEQNNQNDIQQFNSSEEILEKLCNSYQQKIIKLQKDVDESSENTKKLEEIIKNNKEQIEKEEEELKLLEEQIQLKNQAQKQNGHQENKSQQLVQNENKRNTLFQNQYWQTYQIVIHFFGFEYLGKIKDKNNKGDMVAFRFLNKYLCSLQMAKQRQQDKVVLIFIKGLVYSLYNSESTLSIPSIAADQNNEKEFPSYVSMLSSSNIAKITEALIIKNYKNYVSSNGSIIEILQYIGSKLSELEEFYRQMKIISNIYSVSNYSYNSTSLAISFTLKLTQFPQKLVKFIISPESWFNEIQIQVINHPNVASDEIHQKLNEEIDKSINTQFNSKINSQSSYQKLRMIIDAINVKNSIEHSTNESTNTSRLSTTNIQQSSQKE